ncbi:hypothetical protein B0T16DRAFT_445470 [Cercophora newfieldiana]|uniref:Transcriptional regulator n=1 Tax=Cercophora newfieldiana TaxID=92897 RepID=A0AA40CSF2_9PEZI|nr:hypothetical protein B0T16DRAFT_445470 [Cercophora newfieldiana]
MPRTKVPDKATLEEHLRDAVRGLYLDSAELTVNSARRAAERKLKLKEGFFRDDDYWKSRSKEIVRDAWAQVEAEGTGTTAASSQPAEPEPQPTPKAKPKPATKAKPKPKSPPAKRKRAARAPTTEEDEDEDEDDDEISDVESLAKFSDSESEPTTKPAKKRKLVKPKAAVEEVKSEGNSPLSEPSETSKEEDTRAEMQDDTKTEGQEQDGKAEIQEDDGSDTSDVYNEPPKPKGKKAKASEAAPKKRKSQGSAKAAAPEQSSDDALIKQLQGQLVKCGVRKIWGFELKKYGDDKKAKIRHLKEMLSDVGMKGRFSEARAREIKEQRELLADLDAVMEGEKHWGVSGRPARRGRPTRDLKESSEEASDEESTKRKPKTTTDSSENGSESDEDAAPKVHGGGSKRRAGLEFLSDESESD